MLGRHPHRLRLGTGSAAAATMPAAIESTSSGSTSAPQRGLSTRPGRRRGSPPPAGRAPAPRASPGPAARPGSAGRRRRAFAISAATPAPGSRPGKRDPDRRGRPQPLLERAAARRSSASPRPAVANACSSRADVLALASASRRTGSAGRSPRRPRRRTQPLGVDAAVDHLQPRAAAPAAAAPGTRRRRSRRRPAAAPRLVSAATTGLRRDVAHVAAVRGDHERAAASRARPGRSAPGSARRRRRA